MNKYSDYKAHILEKVRESEVGKDPYYHLYIENIFPSELYEAIKARVFFYKYHVTLQDRTQDSADYVNRSYSLVDNEDVETHYVHKLFSDQDIKVALAQKFFQAPVDELAKSLIIHKEFEYMYTAAGRFQNIHVDIPAKFLSFVFYFPENEVALKPQKHNATILYDKNLKPQYKALYKSNSCCVFAPHFYSYHGFSSTIDREVLVMFYVNEEQMKKWVTTRGKDTEPYDHIKNAIAQKLVQYPLLEYSGGTTVAQEKEQCLINARKGRIMCDV